MPIFLSIASHKKPKPGQGILLSILLLLFATISASLGAFTALVAPEEPDIISKALGPKKLSTLWQNQFPYRLSQPVNILVMGVDRVLGANENSPEIFKGRSDTLLVLRFDPNEEAVSLLSIPRDTQVDIPNLGTRKINEANYYGGTELAKQVVSSTLNNITLNRYVRISSGAFQELVDLLGGIEIFVPTAMSYTDRTQNLQINLLPGWQTLNGQQADEFARYRSDGYGDIGRVQRQQALLISIRQRITSPAVLTKLPEIMRIMQKYVDTDLSFEEMLAMMQLGLQLPPENVRMVMLPGESSTNESASYWLINKEGRNRVMYQYFKLDATGYPIDTLLRTTGYTAASGTLKIALQNASGDPQASSRIVKYLADKGLTDVYVASDWPDTQNQTKIIVQKGDLGGAESLQKALGFGLIEAASTGEISSDLTIRIGKDWVNQF